MFSRLLHFLVLASTILATTATYVIKYGPDNSKCLEATREKSTLRDCTTSTSSWRTVSNGLIQSSTSIEGCLGAVGGKGDLKIIPCTSEDAHPWTYDATSRQFISEDNSKKFCMDLKDADPTKEVLVWDCNLNNPIPNQQWSVPVVAYSLQYEKDETKCLESIKGGEVRVGDCSDTRWTTVGDDSSRIHSGSPGNTKDICLHIKERLFAGIEDSEIIQTKCDGAPVWTYDASSRQYKFPEGDLCVEVPDDGNYPKEAKAKKCDTNKANQQWIRKPLN